MIPELPSKVVAAKEELERFCSVQGTRGTLLDSEADFRRAKEKLPFGLIPFMTIEQTSWPDVYALDNSTMPVSVIVWSDHAIVARWDSFEGFLNWTRDEKG
jgi:hypothetical protein